MRHKKPDTKNAQSILDAAERKMKFTLTLPVTEESASTIASNIYECFRMLGDALFVKIGIQDSEHKEAIEEVCQLKIETQRPISAIRNLRHLRHNINYYGYEPSIDEVKDIKDLAHNCFEPAITKIRVQIEKRQ